MSVKKVKLYVKTITGEIKTQDVYSAENVDTLLGQKQDQLVSGTNVATIFGQSLTDMKNGTDIAALSEIDDRSTFPVQSKAIYTALAGKANTEDLTAALAKKVDATYLDMVLQDYATTVQVNQTNGLAHLVTSNTAATCTIALATLSLYPYILITGVLGTNGEYPFTQTVSTAQLIAAKTISFMVSSSGLVLVSASISYNKTTGVLSVLSAQSIDLSTSATQLQAQTIDTLAINEVYGARELTGASSPEIRP